MKSCALRILEPIDAPQYRKIRLQALTEFPASYCSSHESQIQLSKLGFENSILNADKTKPIIGAFENQELIGIVGLNIDGSFAEIVQMYVPKEYQGNRIGSQLLVEAIQHAKLQGVNQIELGVFSPSDAAYKLYSKYGFKGIRTEITPAGDGHTYQLTTMTLSC